MHKYFSALIKLVGLPMFSINHVLFLQLRKVLKINKRHCWVLSILTLRTTRLWY